MRDASEGGSHITQHRATTSSPHYPTTPPPRPGVRARPRLASTRGLWVGIALIPLNCYVVFYAEPVRMMWLTNAAPFANVIFFLFLLTGLNALVARFAPRLALSSADLIVVYVMLSIQTGLGSMNFLHWVMGSISYGTWAATPSNRWKTEFLPHLPAWLMVTDYEALKGYYLGDSTFFTRRHIRAWLVPMLWWIVFFYALAVALVAVAVLFSRQWIRRERLSFPVVELPFQMVSSGSTFWRQRLMWLGFGLAAGAELLNGISFLYPSVPQLPLKRLRLDAFVTQAPWSAIGETNISFYPFVVGLSYLIPVDLSFSLVIFYLFHKAQLIYGAIVGWNEIPNYPFTYNQQFGAGAAIIVVALWGSRDHLRRVWRVAWGGRRTTNDRRRTTNGDDAETRRRGDAETGLSDLSASPRLRVSVSPPVVGRSSVVEEVDPEERRQYRRALVTLAVATVFLVWFMVEAGLEWWMALTVCAMYLLLGLVVSRIRCELGFSLHQMPRMNGSHLLMFGVGAQDLGLRNVTLLALFNSFTVNNQSHILPHQLEGFKLIDREEGVTTAHRRPTADHGPPTDSSRLGRSSLVLGQSSAGFGGVSVAMVAAILVAVPATFLVYLAGTYRLGAGSGHMLYGLSGHFMYDQYLPAWAHSEVYRYPNTLAISVTTGSFLFAWSLMMLRLRFLGWPLHPIGMAVANSNHDITDVVVPVFVGGVVKAVILHYGGLKGYQQVLPFFLGLILGDLVMGMTWIVLAIVSNTPMYQFFL